MTNNNNIVNANSGTVRKIVITVIVLFIAVILVFNSFTRSEEHTSELQSH